MGLSVVGYYDETASGSSENELKQQWVINQQILMLAQLDYKKGTNEGFVVADPLVGTSIRYDGDKGEFHLTNHAQDGEDENPMSLMAFEKLVRSEKESPFKTTMPTFYVPKEHAETIKGFNKNKKAVEFDIPETNGNSVEANEDNLKLLQTNVCRVMKRESFKSSLKTKGGVFSLVAGVGLMAASVLCPPLLIGAAAAAISFAVFAVDGIGQDAGDKTTELMTGDRVLQDVIDLASKGSGEPDTIAAKGHEIIRDVETAIKERTSKFSEDFESNFTTIAQGDLARQDIEPKLDAIDGISDNIMGLANKMRSETAKQAVAALKERVDDVRATAAAPSDAKVVAEVERPENTSSRAPD